MVVNIRDLNRSPLNIRSPKKENRYTQIIAKINLLELPMDSQAKRESKIPVADSRSGAKNKSYNKNKRTAKSKWRSVLRILLVGKFLM